MVDLELYRGVDRFDAGDGVTGYWSSLDGFHLFRGAHEAWTCRDTVVVAYLKAGRHYGHRHFRSFAGAHAFLASRPG